MRSAFWLGRQCLPCGIRHSAPFATRTATRRFATGAPSFIRSRIATPRFPRKTILWSGAGAAAAGGAILSPLAFIDISNDEAIGDKTHEEAMLEASRKELEEQVPIAIQSSKKYRRGIYFFVDQYIVEPICTGLRFLHLVVIFVPVIVTIPALWLGQKQPGRENERSGTLWWYGFLVASMERAGAAFIKVRFARLSYFLELTYRT
jgi:aarF domain-containing kinase